MKMFNFFRINSFILFLVMLVIVSCKYQPSVNDLKGKNPEQVLKMANDWSKKGLNVTSTLTSRAIIFIFENGKRISYPLSDKKMAVSIAPYIKTTHT